MFTRIQDMVSASSGKLRPLRIMNRDGSVDGRRGCGWRTRIWHGVLVAALMMTALPMGVVHATGMTVTTTADLAAADGFCSLREAISAANLNTAVYECPAGSNTETDVITLENGATYALTTGGYLEISDNSATTDLVIGVSGGGSAEINANAIANRVLHVASGASVEITGVAIRYGYRVNEGAGILNDGTLKLVACTISDNVTNSYTDVAAGGGICNRGTLTLDSSIVRHNDARNFHGDAGYGGGIYNGGVLTIQNGTVIGGEDYQDTNKASYGAGIFAALGSTTTIDDSTIKNNWAVMYGGGIYVNGATMGLSETAVSLNQASSGAGIYNAGTLTIQNGSMVGGEGDGNAADYDGGGVYNVGNLTIDASEVSANRAWQNGGGLLNTGTVTIQNGSAIGAENATNAAYLGGGIYNSGALTVDGSSVSGNLAGEWWGPVTGLGGGLYNLGTLVIGNGSTIGGAGKGNSALVGGGIYNNGGTTAVTGSRILENSAINEGDALYNNVNSSAAASVTGSCIVGNGSTAFYNNQPAILDATGNWWGDAAGPGPVGEGHGDTVGSKVAFSGFLVAPILSCPTEWVDYLAAPNLMLPSDGSISHNPRPTFQWSSVAGASGYRVVVDDDPGFSNPVADNSGTELTFAPSSDLAEGTYYWKVRATPDGYWSDTWTVLVELHYSVFLPLISR